ncbi:dipeptide/oligopeptide/nickel ABC transporter permease/ATP-binding protein [Roseomonas sp. OT10]|uniref:dipeptide/oligopeptide/nickel ABC transporter permease/ATP-binding protein n=1 Tax=Roseomonas cutis TaxID=2897332 RepID=UPI001E3587FF|nr:dipeptide/oligopeptide/nickel ABC transporter permease/ATP-binding protein [Roseomonas sp. OT10]UFN47231.1 dipeptide/oligopeptide/nickel ABC transporter permease/ATP-binding protein [Roseomonas sp. OT10]
MIAALRRPAAAISAALVLLALALALLAPVLPLPDPHAMDGIPYSPPGEESWLGFDNFGRDVLSRLVWGARLALLVAIGSAALSVLLGVTLGALAGWYGGWVDTLLGRLFDIFLLIPSFFLALLVVALFGSGTGWIMAAIALTTWPRPARITRAQVLALRERTYVQAARAAGASDARTLLRHVLPNALPPIVTDATLLMGSAVLIEAGLSFLGLGDQDAVSWGRMIFEGQRHLRLAPWISVFPGLALLLLVAALNLLGDALNQSLNPALRRMAERVPPRPPVEAGAAPPPDPAAPLLSVRDLRLEYRLGGTAIRAVDGVSLDLARGEALGVVGESGCGKSSLGAALLQVLPANAALTAGEVRFAGRPLLLDGRPVRFRGVPAMRDVRWSRLSVVFQGAMNALNPVRTIRRQLVDAYRLHRPGASRAEAEARAAALFDAIGIPRARLSAYPHELSGGMRQRAMIALALLLEPELVIADEPTTALDVIVQDQILGELDALRRRLGLTLVLISHDLGAVAETCDRVAVMYAGEIVEIAPAATVFEAPGHPYTRALVGAQPSLHGPRRRVDSLPGAPFVATGPVAACRFAERCPMARPLCRETVPPMVPLAPGHAARCHFAGAVRPEPARALVPGEAA